MEVQLPQKRSQPEHESEEFDGLFENQRRVRDPNQPVSKAKTSSSMKSDTQLLDAVHGTITLPEYLMRIINTKWFQRLRYLHQLGVASYVFPTGNHKRFEHSVGTAYLALYCVRKLREN